MPLCFAGVTLLIKVGNGDIRPFFCKCIGHGTPNAAVAACDERGFSFEFAAAFHSRVFSDG